MTDGLVLITGGDGQLAQVFLRHKGERHRLRLTYLDNPIEAPGHEVIQLDITNFDHVLSAMQGVKAVVHLAADSAGQGPWKSLLPNNVEGTYNVFEAARLAGVYVTIR